MKMHDIFGPGSNFKERFVPDYGELVQRITACRQLGLKIVLTSGTFDVKNIGHSRYLERGKEFAQGGILVVGVDSDEKVRQRKGEGRPVNPQDERLEELCHTRHVDLVTLKPADAPKWELIRIVKPDVLLITKEEYDTLERLAELRNFCQAFGGEVAQVPRQATTSSSAKIRAIIMGLKHDVKKKLQEVITWIDEI